MSFGATAMGKAFKLAMANLRFKHHENECCRVQRARAGKINSFSGKCSVYEVRGRTEFV